MIPLSAGQYRDQKASICSNGAYPDAIAFLKIKKKNIPADNKKQKQEKRAPSGLTMVMKKKFFFTTTSCLEVCHCEFPTLSVPAHS